MQPIDLDGKEGKGKEDMMRLHECELGWKVSTLTR